MPSMLFLYEHFNDHLCSELHCIRSYLVFFMDLKVVFWELSPQNIYKKRDYKTGPFKSSWLPNVNINCCLSHLWNILMMLNKSIIKSF